MPGQPERGQKAELEPITPLAIEMSLPYAAEPPAPETRRTMAPETPEGQPGKKHPRKRRGLFASISDVLFSLAIFMILIVILTSGTGSGMPKTIFDFAYFTVVTPSMQDEIPQGSFILVKQLDPLDLKVGDNITYMADRTTSVTHKIIGIYENYDSSGARGFQTKGVNNAKPDQEIVYEANVVGKVILVLPVVGMVLTALGENVFLAFMIFGLCVLLSFLIRGVFVKPAKRKSPEIKSPGIKGGAYKEWLTQERQ
jgi:signal peptidase